MSVLLATESWPGDVGRGLAVECLHMPFPDADLPLAIEAAVGIQQGRTPPTMPPNAFHLR